MVQHKHANVSVLLDRMKYAEAEKSPTQRMEVIDR
jgi:hypothetical protein